MIDSNNIIYFVKEYFSIIFYLLIIFNIVIRVIVTKKGKKKKKKKKSHKGGGKIFKYFTDFLKIIGCIITFGWFWCEYWDDKVEEIKEVLRMTPSPEYTVDEDPDVYDPSELF